MKAYAKRFNAQRAARAELGDDAIEGVNYRTVKTGKGWTWEPGRKTADPKPTEENGALPAPQPAPEQNAAAPATRHQDKRAAIEAAAQNGILPEPPDFSAETHRRFRNKLASVVKLAKARDLSGLRAFEINPVSSSPKAIKRYRDLCIMALEARR